MTDRPRLRLGDWARVIYGDGTCSAPGRIVGTVMQRLCEVSPPALWVEVAPGIRWPAYRYELEMVP